MKRMREWMLKTKKERKERKKQIYKQNKISVRTKKRKTIKSEGVKERKK